MQFLLEQQAAAEARLKRVVPVVQVWGGPIGLGFATRLAPDQAGLVALTPRRLTSRMPLSTGRGMSRSRACARSRAFCCAAATNAHLKYTHMSGNTIGISRNSRTR